jgi:hypothetical protein
MVAVHEIPWEEASVPGFETTTRQLWREAVASIVTKAHEKLPDCSGRIDRAARMVLAGDVVLVPDGTAQVASQFNGTTAYHVVNGHCDCRDYEKAPHQLCKHRLAAAIARRAQELVKATLHGQGASEHAVGAPAAPVAAASPDTTPVPPRHAVFIQGKPFVRYCGLLQMAQERGLVALTATWTYNDADLSLAHAVATFQDGRTFTECGDATPANTTRKVAVHFRRVALTRAKARALRDALGVDLVSVEELAEE